MIGLTMAVQFEKDEHVLHLLLICHYLRSIGCKALSVWMDCGVRVGLGFKND